MIRHSGTGLLIGLGKTLHQPQRRRTQSRRPPPIRAHGTHRSPARARPYISATTPPSRRLAAEMKSGNIYVRLHAAQALDALGSRAAGARQALTTALNDPNEYVKRVAEHAIAAIPAV